MPHLKINSFLCSMLILFGFFSLRLEAKTLPQDLGHHLHKVENCIHFSGEENYDKNRAKEIEKNIQESCTGLKKADLKLRKKYAGKKEILKALDNARLEYEKSFGGESFNR